MLSVEGIDCKTYQEKLGDGAVPQVSCPDEACDGTLLRGHGRYRRYLGGTLQPIRRLRCPRCGVSHAILPEDVCAYRDVTLGTVELALVAPGPSAGARAAGQAGSTGVRRVRGLRSQSAQWAEQLSSLLPPAEGAWWQRSQKVFGGAAGWLTRLRHWLWSSWRCFFGGLSGVYRHGRPRQRSPATSPYLGSCPKAVP
jgi:hypothetical protein